MPSDDDTVLISRNENTTVNVYRLPNSHPDHDGPACNRTAETWITPTLREARNRYGEIRRCVDCGIIAEDAERTYRHKQGPTECKFCGTEVCAETHLPDHLTECPAFHDDGRSADV